MNQEGSGAFSAPSVSPGTLQPRSASATFAAKLVLLIERLVAIGPYVALFASRGTDLTSGAPWISVAGPRQDA